MLDDDDGLSRVQWQDDSGASGGWEKSTGVTQGSDNDNSELVSMLQSTLHSQKA